MYLTNLKGKLADSPTPYLESPPIPRHSAEKTLHLFQTLTPLANDTLDVTNHEQLYLCKHWVHCDETNLQNSIDQSMQKIQFFQKLLKTRYTPVPNVLSISGKTYEGCKKQNNNSCMKTETHQKEQKEKGVELADSPTPYLESPPIPRHSAKKTLHLF